MHMGSREILKSQKGGYALFWNIFMICFQIIRFPILLNRNDMQNRNETFAIFNIVLEGIHILLASSFPFCGGCSTAFFRCMFRLLVNGTKCLQLT